MTTISSSTTLTTAYQVASDTTGTLVFQTGSAPTTAVTIDGSQNVGIGTSSPAAPLDVVSASSNGYGMSLRGRSSDNASTFNLYNNAGSTRYGFVYADVGGPQVGSVGALPLAFYTNGSERMRVNAGAPILCLSGGNTSATGTGIAFPATQSASSDVNTLDDYEEGTWTPVYQGSTTNPTVTYVSNAGVYVKIGRFVYASMAITTNAYSGGSGDLRIGGLPFAPNGADQTNSGASIGLSVFFTTNPGAVQLIPGQTYLAVMRSINNVVSPVTDLASGTFNNVFRASFCYAV